MQKKEQIKEMLFKIKEAIRIIEKELTKLEKILFPVSEKIIELRKTNYSEHLYQQCDIKEGCTIKNCVECPYKKEGKKYYMGGIKDGVK